LLSITFSTIILSDPITILSPSFGISANCSCNKPLNDTIITNGDIEIDEINEIFRTNIPQGNDYASLSGLLHEKLRDIPKEGDKVIIGSLRIIVEKVLSNKPEKIRIEKVII